MLSLVSTFMGYCMKLIFLTFVLSLVIISCSSDSRNKDNNLASLNESCNMEQKCEDNLACVNNTCISEEEACKYVTCAANDGNSHGTCIVEANKAICNCEEGYQRFGDTGCRIFTEDETCENIICAGNDGKSHGSCDVKSGKAVCTCNEGYKPANNNLNCLVVETPTKCETDTCSGKYGSNCILEGGHTKCVCKEGYTENLDGDCFPDLNFFCKDVICDENKNMTGLCKIEEIEDDTGKTSVKTYCECEENWQGEHCEQSTLPDCSICENDPNATGECRIDQEDENQNVLCQCKENYYYDLENGCVSNEAKKTVITNVRIKTGTLNNQCFKSNACLSGLVCGNNNKCKNATKITKNTIIVTEEESNSELIKVNKDQLIFNKNTRTALFKKGYILAFKETRLLPEGFIGKIKKVKIQKDKVLVNTERISPFEILADTEFNIDDNIVYDTPIDPNVSNSDKTVTKTLNYNEAIYRNTFNISGNMTIKYNFKMKIYIVRNASMTYYKLKQFDLTNNIEFTNDLTLKLKAISFTNDKMKIRYQGLDLLPKQKISTFTVYLPYGVKTKGEVYLSVRALYSGYLQGIANIKLKTKSNFESVIKYSNGKTTRTNDYNTENLLLNENINVDGRAGLTFKIIPEVKFKAYSTNITNNVTIGTEALYTQILLNSKLDSVEKSCYSLEGMATLNTYANLNMMKSSHSNGVVINWNKLSSPKIKNFNWLNGNKKCKNFTCTSDAECRINQSTMANTCNGTCSNGNSSNNNYEFIEIPDGDFVRGCVGTGTE